jgi:hypothetical protein
MSVLKPLSRTAAFLLALGPAATHVASAGEYFVSEVGLAVGPTMPFTGNSPFGADASFREDFDLGLSFNLYATGPIADWLGWRVELGHDEFNADADPSGGRAEGDYTMWRWQIGVQASPFDLGDRGQVYLFATMGLARQDASVSTDIVPEPLGEDGITIDLDGTSNFGLSFGGGYNHLLGEHWGLGGDLHLNCGIFNDATRWWWTPSVQAFYRW